MDYMHTGSRLAVIPSLMENAPYTVLECLVAGIPFLSHAVSICSYARPLHNPGMSQDTL